jgi:hypothetical protein
MHDRLIDLFQFAIQQRWETARLSEYSADTMTQVAFDRDIGRMSAAGFPPEAIERTLGIDIPSDVNTLQLSDVIAPGSSISYPSDNSKVYLHTNSRGITYFLNTTMVTSRGKPEKILLFLQGA